MILWRISAFPDLSGLGGLVASGRWHHAGRPVVYLAENPAGAMLEVLVHLEVDPEDLPRNLRLMRIQVPEHIQTESIADLLPENWLDNESRTHELGDAWLAGASCALLKIPSAIMPHTFNWMLNPSHPGANGLTLNIESLRLDQRLIKVKGK